MSLTVCPLTVYPRTVYPLTVCPLTVCPLTVCHYGSTDRLGVPSSASSRMTPPDISSEWKSVFSVAVHIRPSAEVDVTVFPLILGFIPWFSQTILNRFEESGSVSSTKMTQAARKTASGLEKATRLFSFEPTLYQKE